LEEEVLGDNLEALGNLFGYLEEWIVNEIDNLEVELGNEKRYLVVELGMRIGCLGVEFGMEVGHLRVELGIGDARRTRVGGWVTAEKIKHF